MAAAAAALRRAAVMRRAVLSPAVEHQRRLLLPRLAHTSAYPDEGDIRMAYHAGRIYARKEHLDHLLSKDRPSADHAKEIRLAYLSGRIDVKKEELYDLISEQTQSYRPPRKVSKAHTQLLVNLSAQIKPRIDEPLWFKNLRARRMERLYTLLGSQTFIILAAVGACELIALAEDPALDWLNKRKKLAIDWWKQQLN